MNIKVSSNSSKPRTCAFAEVPQGGTYFYITHLENIPRTREFRFRQLNAPVLGEYVAWRVDSNNEIIDLDQGGMRIPLHNRREVTLCEEGEVMFANEVTERDIVSLLERTPLIPESFRFRIASVNEGRLLEAHRVNEEGVIIGLYHGGMVVRLRLDEMVEVWEKG